MARAAAQPAACVGRADDLVGAEHRHVDRVALRLPRHREVPAPVPERPLHRRRPVDRHRPAGGPRDRRRCRPTRAACTSTRPSGTATTASAPARRSSPRSRVSTSPAPAPRRSPTSAARSTPDQPIVLLDADTGERQPFFAELDAQADPARGPDAHHPPGAQPRRGSPLRRRAAQPAGRRPGRRSPPAAPSASTATASPTFSPPIEQRRAHLEDLFATLAARASAAATSTSRGTSPSRASATSPSGCCTSATTRSPRSAPVTRRRSRSRRSRTTSTTSIYRRVTGTFTVPNYLTGTGAPGSGFNDGSRRAAGPQRRLRGRVHLQHPPRRERRRRRAGHPVTRRGVRARAARQQRRGERRATCARWRTSTTSPSARRSGPASPRTTSAPRSRRSQNWTNFPVVADRTQQGFLNFLFLARLLHTTDGLRLRSGVPGRRRHAARRHRATCSTTATARAASSAAR